jgi:hypothetical protein
MQSKIEWGEKDYILREITFDYVEGKQYSGSRKT